MVAVPGRVVRTDPLSPRGDRFDAALIVVDEGPEADQLAVVALAWEKADIPPPQPAGTQIILHGYPHRDAERTKGRSVQPRRSIWDAEAADVDAFAELGLVRDEHVVAIAPLDRVIQLDGSVSRGIQPSGVSGSGMWILTDGRPAQLIAIFTDARAGYFIGTPVIAHALLLRKNFPSIYSAFDAVGEPPEIDASEG